MIFNYLSKPDYITNEPKYMLSFGNVFTKYFHNHHACQFKYTG